MIAFALAAALSVQTVPAADPLADFVFRCVETRADAGQVRYLVLHEGGWTPVQDTGDMTSWSREIGGHVQTLTVGRREISGPKDICSIQWRPSDASLNARLPDALAPVTATINADEGLYAVAASSAAFEARDFDFVSVTHDAEMTTLILLRPIR